MLCDFFWTKEFTRRPSDHGCRKGEWAWPSMLPSSSWAPVIPTVVLCFPVVCLTPVYTEVAALETTCLLLVCICSKSWEKPDISCDIWALKVTLSSSPPVIAGLYMALGNESILRNQFSLILASPLLFTFLPRQGKIQGLGINRKLGGVGWKFPAYSG